MDDHCKKTVCVVGIEDNFSKNKNSVEIDHSKYKFEENRLSSFHSWPTHYPVNPSRLAKSGFFSIGIGDEVICFSCGGQIDHWQFGDIVQKKHRELFPTCDFINNKSDNIPFHQLKTNSDVNNISNSASCTHANNDAKIERLGNNLQNISGNNHCQKLPSSSDLLEQNSLCNDSDGFMNKSIPVNSLSMSGSIPNFEKLVLEEERLKTFKCGWPLPYLNILELAKAGFFYLGCNDKVQCAFCHGIVSSWEANDVPIIEHSRHFPFCKFVLQHLSNKLEHLNFFNCKEGQDICGNADSLQQVATEDTYKLIDKTQQHTRLEELGVRIYNGPIHPQQATFQARIRSYSSWPENTPVQKEDLAAAGFFYIGINDHTKCFHCDGGLCSWEGGDDPWVEHARWFRNCSFVHLNKGDDFIHSCIMRTLKNYEMKTSISQQTNVCKFVSNDGLMQTVDDCMKTSLINSVVETGIFPSNLIKAAVFKQLQEHSCPFSNVDEICEAISSLKEKSPLHIREKNEMPKCSKSEQSLCSASQKSFSKVGVKQMLDKKDCEDSKLEEENSYLKDQRLCKVCMDHDVNVVFLPCGHLLTCTSCAPALKDCPGCRKIIQATVRVYLP